MPASVLLQVIYKLAKIFIIYPQQLPTDLYARVEDGKLVWGR